MNLTTFYLAVAGLILAPLVGGLVAGLDRVVTARLQSRMGPPLLQPFYDVGKLMSKVIPPPASGRACSCAGRWWRPSPPTCCWPPAATC